MSDAVSLTTPALPPLGSDRVSFKTVEKQGAYYAKQLLIDGQPVHEVVGAEEPEDYQVYVTYLAELDVSADADQCLGQNFNDYQLHLLGTWLTAKAAEYKQRLGEESEAVISAMAADVVTVMKHVKYEPTTAQMIGQLGEIADVLEANQAKKAAQKLRMVGNMISRV